MDEPSRIGLTQEVDGILVDLIEANSSKNKKLKKFDLIRLAVAFRGKKW